jgi:hypothetical protein
VAGGHSDTALTSYPGQHMTFDPLRSPRGLAVLCAAIAMLLGFVHMVAGGAPLRYLAINAAAFAIGSAVLVAMGGKPLETRSAEFVAIAGAGVLLTVSLFGASVDGVARWVRVGGMLLQPGLILTPLLALAFARQRNVVSAVGIAVAALALALAPDRAMAGALAAGLLAVAVARRGPLDWAALSFALAAWAITMLRADPLPAAPFVERILWTAFAVHPAAGLAVWGGALLLLVPALTGYRRRLHPRLSFAVFGSIWLAVLLAAGLGNYPTPVMGYGSSAILGYLLAIIALPPRGPAART